VFSALLRARLRRGTVLVEKSPCQTSPALMALRPRWPRAKSAQRRRESVGRGSPLRAGVGRTDPASRPESCPPRPYGRGYERWVSQCRKHAVDSGCGVQRTAHPGCPGSGPDEVKPFNNLLRPVLKPNLLLAAFVTLSVALLSAPANCKFLLAIF